MQVVLKLLKHGGSVYSTGNNFLSPLKAVFPNDHVEFVRFLLNRGVSVDITDNDGRATLRGAASNCQLEVIRQLLSNGGSVNIARIHDWTAGSGHAEVFREFLKHRACVVIAIKKCS